MRPDRPRPRLRWEELGLGLYLCLLVLFLAVVLRVLATRRHFAPMTVHPVERVEDTAWAPGTDQGGVEVRSVGGDP